MKSSTLGVRKKIFTVISILILSFLIFRFMSIMLFSSDYSGDPLLSKTVIERGPILDRNGRILAMQTRLYSVTAWIPSIKEMDRTVSILSDTLNLNKNQLKKDISSRPRFMYVKRKITNSEADRLRAYIESGELPGIGLEIEYGRSYPEKELASHLIGYTGTDNTGLDGIEYTYNNMLSPQPSAAQLNRDIYGNQVFLTIDANVQNFAHEAALEAYEKYEPESIMLIVAEAKTGDILAYVSAPEIDLNNFATASPESKINHPLVTAYEPGSVFKVFSIASLLHLGGMDEHTEFYCNGFFVLNQDSPNPIRIRCLGNHGYVDAEQILRFSCNAGSAYASLTASDDNFYQMLKMFNFGESTATPLPGETRGLLREYRLWSARSKPTISMGQEISVSAMQIVRAATVFANSGVMLQPHIVSKIVSYDNNTIDKTSREPIRQVISANTAQSVLDMMRVVAESGTGWRASVPGITMAVKTGTSQTLDRATGTYSDKEFISSCLALFPAEDPQVIVYTAIYKPSKINYLGGVIAAPLVGDVADKVVSYLGIPRKGDTVINHSGKISVTSPQPFELGATIPNFAGFSKRQLLPLLNDSRIKVQINGDGWVTHQYPEPGTIVTEGMIIRLDLE